MQEISSLWSVWLHSPGSVLVSEVHLCHVILQLQQVIQCALEVKKQGMQLGQTEQWKQKRT